MRAALCLCASSTQSTSQYVTLWSTAARSGWGIAGVFVDSGSGDEELRRLIAQREIDVVLAWRADHLSRELLDAIGSHEPGAQPPDAEPERKGVERVRVGIARARANGKRLGRPRIDGATEDTIRAALAAGHGIRATARGLGVGVSVVQRVRAERLGQAGSA